MGSMIGLLNAAIVKLYLKREQTLKLHDWVVCMLYIPSCLVSYMKSFPPHTAPAGYVCPTCSTSIWPPKSIKDSGSRLHSKLKEAIMQSGLEKNLFGNHPVSFGTESRNPPPAFASEPLMHPSVGKDAASTATGSARPASLDIVEIDGPSLATSSLPNHEPSFMRSTSPTGPGATTRKSAQQVERTLRCHIMLMMKMRTGRSTLRHKLLRSLLPFWSSALPTLPVTAPPRKETSHADDASESRVRHHKSSRMDPRKLLLVIAIMACMATMGILYYRIAQRGLGEDVPEDEMQ
ncbi:UNVERIFIED_CONTAM: hypothetical protein Slati_3275800 [Sesamum latifolium]|uniref:ZFPL1-like U-box domain-containing protein n=1 Tax=Sesamum latifolium TaxID=2727402 RepID=A0AAW2UZ42_9LAMI